MIRNLEELAVALNSLYPTRYSHFNNKQAMPFICYIDQGSDNFHADSTIYSDISNIDIELYTEYKDIEAEQAIANLLLTNELVYDRSPTVFIESEETYQTVFTIQLLNNGGILNDK